MLQNMREGTGKWLVWVVIILLIVALSLWGISSYFMDGGSATHPAAKVGENSISQEQVNATYSRLQLQQPQAFAHISDTTAIKQQLLDNLITQNILAQAASKAGFVVSDAMLDSVITQIPAFQNNGQFSAAQFSMVLNRLMYTPAQFTTEIRNMMLISQIQNGLDHTSFVLPNEVSHWSSLNNQTRNIGYLIIPMNRFMNKTNIQPAQIQAYYDQHQSDYKTQEELSISYVEITPQDVLNTVKPMPTELKNYYQDNIANYTSPARWHVAHILLMLPPKATPEQLKIAQAKLSQLRAQIEKGVSFAQLAKDNSQDMLTAKKGGELPWFTAGSLGGTFEQAVATLKPNQVSQPVQTQYGYELIKILAVQPQTVTPYEQVASQVTAAYKNQQLQKIMANKNEALANVTFENPDSLAPAAKQLGLTIMTTPLFTRLGLGSGVAANKKVVSAAFADDVLLQSNNSDVVTLDDGSLVVLRVNQHLPATVKPLAQVQASIAQQLQRNVAQELVKAFGDQLTLQISDDQTAKNLAQKNQLTWVNKTNVTRAAVGINPEILVEAFKQFAPHKPNTLSVKGFALQNGDYAIVGISSVNLGQPSKDLHNAEQTLLSLLAQANEQAYLEMQKDAIKVKRYN